MKKHIFYSLIYSQEKGGAIAQKQDGYTDIYFNYYKFKNIWYAIEPSTGLSVATGNTRKEAQRKAMAPAMLRKINEHINQDKITTFQDLVTAAQCL